MATAKVIENTIKQTIISSMVTASSNLTRNLSSHVPLRSSIDLFLMLLPKPRGPKQDESARPLQYILQYSPGSCRSADNILRRSAS